MERLNLYTSKRKKLKLRTLLVLMFVMLIPGLMARFILDFSWKHDVEMFNITYRTILNVINYNLTGKWHDIEVISNSSQNYRIRAQVLKAKQRETILFIKNAYFDKSILKRVFKAWRKDPNDWMMLESLSYDNNKFSIDFYEIYKPGIQLGTDRIKSLLAAFGVVTQKIDFDLEFIENLRMRKVVMQLNVRKASE